MTRKVGKNTYRFTYLNDEGPEGVWIRYYPHTGTYSLVKKGEVLAKFNYHEMLGVLEVLANVST